MSEKNPLTWSDIERGHSKEMMKHYGFKNNLDLERAIRKHTDGATNAQVKEVYNKFFNLNKGR